MTEIRGATTTIVGDWGAGLLSPNSSSEIAFLKSRRIESPAVVFFWSNLTFSITCTKCSVRKRNCVPLVQGKKGSAEKV